MSWWLSAFEFGLLLTLGVYLAWRYALVTLDPDAGLFMAWGMVGAAYGRDFADCKTPAVHLLYLVLTRLVGRDVVRVKFAYHLLVNAGAAAIVFVAGPWAALALLVLVNAGWLWTWHGNVGQVPAVLLAWSLAGFPWLAGLAVMYEPKLALSVAALWLLGGRWDLLAGWGTVALIGGLFLRAWRPQWWAWVWEANVTIPRKMVELRRGMWPWAPWFTSQGVLYLMPWAVLAAWARPEWQYWLPPVLYWILTGLGRVVRPLHLIPLVAWVALAGLEPGMILLLLAVDIVSGGFYLGDIWYRFYPGLWDGMKSARSVAESLQDLTGDLYVDGMDSQIYIYANKPPTAGMVYQVEIANAIHERLVVATGRLSTHPPEWIVSGPHGILKFDRRHYRVAGKTDFHTVYQRVPGTKPNWKME